MRVDNVNSQNARAALKNRVGQSRPQVGQSCFCPTVLLKVRLLEVVGQLATRMQETLCKKGSLKVGAK